MAGTERNKTEKLIYGWLLLAVFSLVFAGVFALLLAIARTPGLEGFLPLGRNYIYVVLVGHVVLAFVIWFLAFEGFLWLYATTAYIERPVCSPALGWASLLTAASGVSLVVISAVFGLGEAELANYIPVLLTPVFYAGLTLFAAGITGSLVNAFLSALAAKRDGIRLPAVTFGMLTCGAAVFVAMVCFALYWYFHWSTGKAFVDFERLFWGGGHILQFANTIAMTTVWVWLVRKVLGREPMGTSTAKLLYALYLVFIIPAPLIYFIHDTSTQAYKDSFTMLMEWGLGPSTAVFIAAGLWSVAVRGGRNWTNPAFSSVVLSMAIFLVGGFISLTFTGVNTKIPAHYHCVIGAVTIAFMGLFFEVMPVIRRKLYSDRMAKVLPYLYFSGVLLFAAGLYVAGSHGVARKTYGGDQNLDNFWKVLGMSVMGVGGLVAISGGITFVLNALLTLLGSKTSAAGTGKAG